MTTANAPRCIANTLVYEGAFGRNAKDRGDWTSGVIGQGRLSGTAYGIAAMTLKDRGLDPDMDLRALTKDQAIGLYMAKEWPESAGDLMPKGLDQITWDAVVNSGKGRGVPWTGKAVGCPTPTNARAVATTAMALSFDRRRGTVKKAIATRLAFLQGLSIAPTFIGGWTKRCVAMEAIGVKMVLEDQAAAGQPVDQAKELQKEAGVAKGKAAGSATVSTGTGSTGAGGATQIDPNQFDWTAWLLAGAVGVVILGVAVFFAWQAYKNWERMKAYAAAALGHIGG
jgi:lysozyme family protein